MFRYLLIVLTAFMYFFPARIEGLPGSLNTRVCLSLFGAFYLFFNKGGVSRLRIQWKGFKPYVFYVILILVISLLTSFQNGVFEKQFLIYPINWFITVLSCYCLFLVILKTSGKIVTTETLIDVYTGVIVLECLLSVLSFYFPAFNSWYYSIVALDSHEQEFIFSVIDSDNKNRFAGVGVTFFGAGVAFSLCLFLVCVRFLSKTSISQKILYVISFIFIVFVGSAISRTTQVGGIIGIAYILIMQIKENRKRLFSLKTLSISVVVISLFLLAINLYFKYIENDVLLETVFRHAFEGFYNLFEEGRFHTHSSDESIDNYMWPDTLASWMLGDGRLNDPSTIYYKAIDVGWCRLVFYFGIIGSLVYVMSQGWLFKKMRIQKYAKYCVFVLFCLYLSKGLVDLMAYVMPFVLLNLINYRQVITKKDQLQ